jgi:fructoselysine-6-phosphate deglycase
MFDVERYLAIQSAAAGFAEEIDAAVQALIAKGANNVFFLGTGGAAILMQPAALLLQRQSTFPCHTGYSAELILAGAASLGEQSIVIMPSLSGTTSESIEALKAVKKLGAKVIALVGKADTPLANGADHVLVNRADDDTSSESFYIQSLLIALSILKQRGEIRDYEQIVREVKALPRALVQAKHAFAETADALAQSLAAADYHIFVGAGNSWPEAHYYAMCILEEMQWIRTRPVHASDFFHGTLELIEKGVSVVVLQGEDSCRPLTERVVAFARQYTDRLRVIDTAEIVLPGISATSRGLLSPVVHAAVLESVSARLEVMRDHPLTTRRYYKRVAY